ncbi:MAG: hypothetical protein GEU28_05665 [Dehalococcoidia bacterium]|nr:hypothetical protein [Dehalococcoidia bacterium]
MTDERKSELATADLAATGSQNQATEEEIPEDLRATRTDEETSLLPADQAETLRRRWDEIQGNFVDEPRTAVEGADGLVAETMQRLADVFASERSNLERQWDSGEDVSTEDLRVALQRYRSFFNRLLSV